ncbi:MAG: hypothetical protein ISR59_12510 [Anaerolineales bacterium]|nr:hypothetical protein [Anaerolineales bacterium]
MALVRCQYHGKPKGRSRLYVRSVNPVGWPDTAAICGRANCEKPGLIWLNDDEDHSYKQGQRIFRFNNASMKVRAE